MSSRYSSDRSKRTSSWSTSWKNEPSAKRSRFEEDTYEPQLNKNKTETSTRTMLTFRKFMATLDDSLSDEEAIAKYNDYKFDFRKQGYQQFFDAHKEEEWFRNKYHPEVSKDVTEQQRINLKKRLEVYKELVEQKGFGGNLNFDIDNCENLIRFMDSVVIKLEGGSDEDIQLMMSEPISDEAIDDIKKIKVEGTNGSETDQNGNSEQSLANGAGIKMETDNVAITNLLKRVPYKTSSIFFRNIPVSTKIEDLENECKNYPGFLRIGLSEPLNDQNFVRRLWVTFRRPDVNIREIFWNIKDAKFAEGDAQPSVNRELRRRVRTISGIAHHRPIVQNDIRQAARLIALYDHKRKLFIEADQVVEAKDLDSLVRRNKNPLLEGVFEYFVEESNAEEEELLGSSKQDGEDLKFPLEIDNDLLKYLDRLLVYLRLVHSIDYYNYVEYTNEDSMPNRMGMVHVRDFPLTEEKYGKTSSGIPLVPKKEVDLFISTNDERLKSTILKFENISEDDLKRLGKKDADQAVEDFIKANCVEMSQDRWLCPLSGKKFKGPEFIRKHLFSKHEQKIDEARAEAVFFNNYIADTNRPHNPEPKPTAISLTQPAASNDEPSRRPTEDRFSNGGSSYRSGGNWSDRSRFGGGQRFGSNTGSRYADNVNRNRPSDDFGARRQLTSYCDLDAPENII